MRIHITLLALALLLVMPRPADAKKKEPPVYDQTGIVFRTAIVVNHYDSTADVTVNGQNYFAGCDISDTNISCSDERASGGHIMVKLADGGVLPLSLAWEFPSGHFTIANIVDGPLSESMIASSGKPTTFQYRVVRVTSNNPSSSPYVGDYFCVPYTNHKGKVGEACYLQ